MQTMSVHQPDKNLPKPAVHGWHHSRDGNSESKITTEYLIAHPELGPQIGAAGREYVQENYDIKTLNQKPTKIYRSIL